MQTISRDANKYNKRHSVTPNAVVNMQTFTPQQSYPQKEEAFGCVKSFTYQKSAQRSSMTAVSRNYNLREA